MLAKVNSHQYEKINAIHGMVVNPAMGVCGGIVRLGHETISAQIFTISTRSSIKTVSDAKIDLRTVNPRVRRDLWMRPRVSMRATGPAFSEAWRLRMDGKGILDVSV